MSSEAGELQHAKSVSDYADIENYARISQLATNTIGSQTTFLPEGIYDIWCSVDTFIKIHVSDASDVTTVTGYLVRANQHVTFFVRNQRRIGARLASGTGTLDAHKVG